MSAAKQRPITFCRFVRDVLGLTLAKGQLAIASVLFDGLTPMQLNPELRPIAETIFGGAIEIPDVARRTVYLQAGRASGKTTLAIARAIHLLLTNALEGVGKSDRACAIIVSPGIDFSKACAQQAARMVDDSEQLRGLVTSRTKASFVMKRPDGREVEFIAVAKSQGGRTTRGRAIVAGLLDESAFFPCGLADNNPVSDADIINSMMPRLVAGGQLILTSTPWPTPSASAELFTRNFGCPSYALVACAPTPIARDYDPLLMATIAAERERDPANVAREYFCERGASGSSFFDPATIDAAVSATPVLAVVGAKTTVAIDLAFTRDPSTLVAIQRRDGKLYVVRLEERRPRQHAPLVPSEVIGDFGSIATGLGTRVVAGDVHYRETAAEICQKKGLMFVSGASGTLAKTARYTLLREALREKQIVLPNDERLLGQLASVLRREQPGGGISIVTPRRSGAHGDLVEALTLAIEVDRQNFGSLDPAHTGPMCQIVKGGWGSRNVPTRYFNT